MKTIKKEKSGHAETCRHGESEHAVRLESADIKKGKNFVEVSAADSVRSGIRLKLTAPMENVWRLQSAPGNDPFQDEGAVQMLEKLSEEKAADAISPATLSIKEKCKFSLITAQDSKTQAKIYSSPFRMVFSRDKRTCFEIRELSGASGNEVKCTLKHDERIYGTGERFNGVNQRGKKILVWAEDRYLQTEGNSYLPIPFIISTRKYAVLANRFEASTFDLGKTSSRHLTITQKNASLDIYILLFDNPREVYKKLMLLWGPARIPPEWGFGILVSRHLATEELSTTAGIREMASKMKEHGLPWSGAIIEGWDTYNPDTYKELDRIVRELLRDGKKTMVYDACGRLPEKYWKTQKSMPSFFVRDKQGNRTIAEAPHHNPQDAPYRRRSSFIDITNPEAVEWWKDKVWRRLMKTGISGAKIDFCEQFPEDDNIVLFSGRTLKGMHHFYPVAYNIMMSDLFQRYAPEGGLCWSRGGGIGTHRYPFVWCGDQLREFSSLKTILSAILSSGISGIPFMGHDLAGYQPAKNSDDEAGVFVRGVQLSCFSAAMQTHGTVTRPYDFPPETVGIYRFYSMIRYALMPYLLEQARISGATGMPLMRPFFLHYPDDRCLQDCEDQYFLGEDILVAPMLDDAAERSIILPPGRWTGLFDGKSRIGPKKMKGFPAPKEVIPVFVTARPKSAVLSPIIKKIRTMYANYLEEFKP
ncbi:MAG: glycoside hydrolase family 31 protein [Candidatus Omnitrophica bacterium]|nr:glycoside hydrolase family 31 protein [Candidatus Omnitrophota bacterium]